MSKKVIVIGGGPAGIMAAIKAAEEGAAVTILEKNDRLGRKLAITGKGRCNITNSADIEEFIENMPGNGQFLYGPFYTFTNQDMISFLEEAGLKTKEERGGRVFPQSDKASDVLMILEKKLKTTGVKVIFGKKVTGIETENKMVTGVQTADGESYPCTDAVLAVGGASYPATGSTGDGYDIARKLGHSVIPVRPSLVPLETEEEWIKELQGLSLRNVHITALAKGKKIGEDFGEMLFTHFGVTGPIILSQSRNIVKHLAKGNQVEILINLKPALSLEQLDQRVQRDFIKFQRKQLKNALDELLPKSLIPVIINLSNISGDRPVHQINKQERIDIINIIRELRLHISGPRPIKEAIVTAGGIEVKEINPSTMESKLIKGMFFAGEVIDIDGYTGGYNLQAAWSTGYVAGENAGKRRILSNESML